MKNEKQEKVEEIYNYYTISMGIHTNDDWKSVKRFTTIDGDKTRKVKFFINYLISMGV